MKLNNVTRNAGGNGAPGTGWEAQLRKGCLDLAVLATLWDGPRYGLEILRALARQSHLEVAEGTLYPILARLKADGLLQAEWVEAEAGHPRKYYRLAAAGRRRTREMAEAWRDFAAHLATVIEPVFKGVEK